MHRLLKLTEHYKNWNRSDSTCNHSLLKLPEGVFTGIPTDTWDLLNRINHFTYIYDNFFPVKKKKTNKQKNPNSTPPLYKKLNSLYSSTLRKKQPLLFSSCCSTAQDKNFLRTWTPNCCLFCLLANLLVFQIKPQSTPPAQREPLDFIRLPLWISTQACLRLHCF